MTSRFTWVVECPSWLTEKLPIYQSLHFRVTEYFYFFICMISAVLICFSQVGPLVTLWTVACEAPLSMEFSRQEYWSGLPCPPPGDLPLPGIELSVPVAPALQADSLLLSQWQVLIHFNIIASTKEDEICNSIQ